MLQKIEKLFINYGFNPKEGELSWLAWIYEVQCLLGSSSFTDWLFKTKIKLKAYAHTDIAYLLYYREGSTNDIVLHQNLPHYHP